jgi:formate/nitrite transporter FocA (FNT family)
VAGDTDRRNTGRRPDEGLARNSGSVTIETTRKDALDREPREIAERAGGIGRERLDRTDWNILLTATIGGIEVSIGGLAAMLVVGAALALGGFVFPIGLIFVILGRSELFTENFLIPVIAVLSGDRSQRSLFELFAFSWLGNLFGSAIIAALLFVPNAIGELILFGANLSHSIIGASLLFVGFAAAGKTLVDVVAWIVIATIGNLVGGVGLVTPFRFAQAREQGKQA